MQDPDALPCTSSVLTSRVANPKNGSSNCQQKVQQARLWIVSAALELAYANSVPLTEVV